MRSRPVLRVLLFAVLAPSAIPATAQSPPSPPGFAERTPAEAPAAADSPSGVLVPGFNLVSIPNQPDDPAPAAVLGAIAGQVHTVYAYDACDPDDPWKIYDPADPASSNLAAIDHRIGFWLDAGAAVALPAAGTLPERTTIELCRGWNLIGFPLAQARPVRSALYSIEGRYSLVFGYDASDPDDPWEVFNVAAPEWGNDLQVMEPGRGYWVLAREDVTLDLVNTGPPPEAAITGPAEAAGVTTFTDVVGTVRSSLLASWKLSLRRGGDDGPFTEIAAGHLPVDDALLGRFDPTSLLNGLYELRLEANDYASRSAHASIHLTVSGQLKIGVFTLPFLDLELPVVGVPIRVVRTYDSRDRSPGEFGAGWRLTLSNVLIQENGITGNGWQGTRAGQVVPTYCIAPTRSHLVTVLFPDGELFRFLAKIKSPCQSAAPPTTADIEYVALPGTSGQLVPLDDAAEGLLVEGSFPGPVQLWEPSAGEIHDADRYQLTTADGRAFVIDQQRGLESITDSNGNTVRFRARGIEHSSGLGIRFERDAFQRITAIMDPLGGRLSYEYDAGGDLVSVTDQQGLVTRYRYLEDHFLHLVIDPEGREILAAEYDGDGRLIRNCAEGNICTELVHDFGHRQETVIDATGRPLTYTYDEAGNVLSATDALGNTTRAEYSDDGRMTKLIDALGAETTYAYDARGNLLAVTYPRPAGAPAEDFTTYYTYNSSNQATSLTFPGGGQLFADHDARGNLETVRDENGNTLFGYSYAADGALLSQSDPFMTVTYSDLEATGEPRKITGPRGSVTTAAYDATGNVRNLQTDRYSATFTYDRKGRKTADEFSNGLAAERSYGATDHWIELRGPTYGRIRREFETGGRLLGWDVEGIGRITYTYDAAGRPLRETDPLNHPTSYGYDPAGQLQTITDAKGAVTSFGRDAVGRVTRSTNALGHSTWTSYGADGRGQSITDAKGNTWTLRYTPTTTTIRDPLERETTLLFSPHGLPIATIHPDGSRTETTYLLSSPMVDADEYPTSTTDEGGHERVFTYNAIGQLASATDLGGTPYTYEHNGANLERVTGPVGELVFYGYDNRNNIAEIGYPDGGVERRAYGTDNLPAVITRPSGVTIDLAYDVGGRLLRRTPSGEPPTTFSWDAANQLVETTDERGKTSYRYDSQNDLVEITYPHGATVRFTRDLLGQVTAVELRSPARAAPLRTEYTYDAVGNLVSLRDPLGGQSTFEHDGANRLVRRVLPNGVVTELTYNARDQITAIVHRSAAGEVLASAGYERGANGEPRRIDDESGAYVLLDYDNALRLRSERYHDPDGKLVEAKTYAYDLAGNRLQTSAAGSISTYGYGPGQQLVSIAGPAGDQFFSFDADGRLRSMDRDGSALTLDYDSADQLRAVRDESGDPIVTYAYDAVGRRVSAGTAAGERSFLLAPAAGTGLESSQLILGPTGALAAGYVYAGDRPLLRFGPDGPVYYLEDALGSVIGLSDGHGSRVASFQYDGFGNLRHSSGPASALPAVTGGDFRFHGEWLEAVTGFYHLRARDYDSRVGRFLTRDAAAPDLTVPESLHPYNFAFANPLVFRDPSGLFSLMTVNLNLSIQGILHSIKLAAIQQARGYLTEKIGETLTRFAMHMIFEVMFAPVSRFNSLRGEVERVQGIIFENTLRKIICGLVDVSFMWFETVIEPSTGRPERDGWRCPKSSDDPRGSYAELGQKKPDFLFKKGRPTNLTEKGVAIGDFKLGILTFYNEYVRGGNRGQWQAMYRHARNHQYFPHVVVFVAFRRDKRAYWGELAELAIAERVALIIFSFQ